MARPAALAALAIEAQVVLRDTRRAMAPMYESAIRSGDVVAIAEAKAIADTIRSAEKQARWLAGYVEGLIPCADGLFGPAHGKAA